MTSNDAEQDWPLHDAKVKGRKGVSVNPLTRVLRSLQGGSGKVKEKAKSPRGAPVESRTAGKEAQEIYLSPRTSEEEQDPLVDHELAHNIEAAEASLLELRDLSTAARSFTRPHGPKNESPLAAYKPGVSSPRCATSIGYKGGAHEEEGEVDEGLDEEHLVAPRTKSESAAREAWHAARRQRQAQEQAAAHGGGPSLEALLQRKSAAHAGTTNTTTRHKRPPRKNLSSLSQVSTSNTSQQSGPGTPLSGTPPSHSLMGGGPFTLGRFKAMMAHQQRSQAATPTSGSSGQPGSPEPSALMAGAEFTAPHYELPTKSKTFSSLPNAGSLSSQDAISGHPLPSKYANLHLRTDAPPNMAHTLSASPSPSPSGGLAPSPNISGSLPPPFHRISHGPGAPLSPLASRRISHSNNSSTSLPAVRRTSLSMPGLSCIPPAHTAGSVGFAVGTHLGESDMPASGDREKPHAPSRSATHTTLLPDLAPPKSLSRPSAPPVLAGSADSSPRASRGASPPPLQVEGSYMQATASSINRAEPQHGFDPSMRSLSRSRSRNRSGRSRRGSEVGGRTLVKRNSSKRLLKKSSSKRRSGKRRSSSGRSGSATTAHTPHSQLHSGPSRGSSSVGSRFAGSSFAADTDSEKDDDGDDNKGDTEDAASRARRSVDGEREREMEDTPLCEPLQPAQQSSRPRANEQQLSSSGGVGGGHSPTLRGVLPQMLQSQESPGAPSPLGRASPSLNNQQQQASHAPHMAQPSPLGLAPTLSSQAADTSNEAISSWVHAHSPAGTDHAEREGNNASDALQQSHGRTQLSHQPTPPPHSGAANPDSLASKAPLLSATKHARFNLPLNTSSSTGSSSKPRPPPVPPSAGQARNPALRPSTSTPQDMNEGKLTKMKGDLRSYLAGQRMDVTRLEADSYLYKLEVECKTRPMGRFAGNKKVHKNKGSATAGEGTHQSHAPLSKSAEAPSYLSRTGAGGEGVGASLAAMLAGLDEDEQELKRLQARSRAARAGRPEPRDTREVEHREKWV